MNCEQAKQHFDDKLDDALGSREGGELQEHIAECAHCRTAFEYACLVKESLRDLPMPAPTADFENRVFARLDAENNRPSHRRWFAAGFGSAVAASVALWLAFTALLPLMQGPSEAALPSIALAVDQPYPARFAFDVPADFDDVILSIELPEGVEVDGYANRRTISWRTDLSSGQNVLTLPVIAKRPSSGIIVATLTSAGKSKVFRIKTEAGEQNRSLIKS